MSEVKRYLIQKTPIGTMMKENPEGNWVAADDFDAQRLRADTAEADLLRTSDALIAAEQRIAKFEDLLKDMRALPQKRCATFIVQIIDVLDGPRAALNPSPEAESHE